jgi:hypothetical protein
MTQCFDALGPTGVVGGMASAAIYIPVQPHQVKRIRAFASGVLALTMRRVASASFALRGRESSRSAGNLPPAGLRNLKDRKDRFELRRNSSYRPCSDRSDVGFVRIASFCVVFNEQREAYWKPD